MTDFVPFTSDEYAPDAPGTSLHFERWFRNWIAGFEGAAGAPRLDLAAINRLTVGDSIRFRRDTLQNIATSTFATILPVVSIMQSGTVRFNFQFRRTVNGTAEVRALRQRAGGSAASSVVTTTSATFVSGLIQMDVIPGDTVSLQMRNTNGTSTDAQNVRLCVGANDFLWPAPGLFGEIEGNPALLVP